MSKILNERIFNKKRQNNRKVKINVEPSNKILGRIIICKTLFNRSVFPSRKNFF